MGLPDLSRLTTVAFDADDTLWHNEMIFRDAETRIAGLLAEYEVEQVVKREMYRVEIDNLPAYGYGVKGFTLSMIELADRVSEGCADGAVFREIIAVGKGMLGEPVAVMPGVREVLERLRPHYRLILVTKGDLLDQRRKLTRSGLADFFHHVEVVSDKTSADYAEVLTRLDIAAPQLLMVGNSLRSDVLPLLALGVSAVHIPYAVTWEHERASVEDHHDYVELAQIGELPGLLGH